MAANCASCHGVHDIRPSSDPKSMIYKDNLLHFDPDGLMNAVTDKTKIIVIPNPNNPSCPIKKK